MNHVALLLEPENVLQTVEHISNLEDFSPAAHVPSNLLEIVPQEDHQRLEIEDLLDLPDVFSAEVNELIYK